MIEPLLRVDAVSRSFPGVKAVDAVSLRVAHGEIQALLGENGAGKSTLVKIIYGVLQPDAGSLWLDGQPYSPRSPAAARQRGVGMVFQHFAVFEALTVVENVALGLPGTIADQALAKRIETVSRTYGLDIAPDRVAGTLSSGERQRIEIVRCLLQDPRLIIMDEPTSVLTAAEAATLFETLRRLAAEGRSILYISHKLDEIRALCSTATIMRGGRLVGVRDPRRETAASLAELMIGEKLQPPSRAADARAAVRFAVDSLSLPASGAFGTALSNISFDVRAGEILGIAGIAGNGQGELMDVLIGETPVDDACIRFDGAPVGASGPMERRRLGLAFVPEERLGHGAAPAASLTENMLLAETQRGFIDWRATATAADRVIARFNVKTPGADRAAQSLSGGNLQKFIVGREIATNPQVLIAAQPTWGVDAGAAALIHAELVALARSGAAILLISQDLDELFALCHRIGIIAGGALTPLEPASAWTAERIGRAMGSASAVTSREGVPVHA